MTKFKPGGPKRYAHQREILRRIVETKGVCALLCEPGTGKTAPTLDYLNLLAIKSHEAGLGGEIRALVVSPKAAVDNWVIQAETYRAEGVSLWAEALGGSILEKAATIANRGTAGKVSRRVKLSKRKQVLASRRALHVDKSELVYVHGGSVAEGPRGLSGPRVVLLSLNYDSLASRKAVGSGTMADVILGAVKEYAPHVIVCDESHKLKGPSSNTSRLMARVGALARRRLMLTGTVMPHSPMDVFAQWRYLAPEAFGQIDPRTGERKRATYAGFERTYGVLGGFMGKQVVAYKNLDQMHEIMGRNAVVVKKQDALDLPQAVDAIVPLTLSQREATAYAEMKKELATELQGHLSSVPNRLVQGMRLRQITAGFLKSDDGTLHDIGDTKVSAIASLANDTLAGERRIVIFAAFRHEIDRIRDAVAQKGTEVYIITGETAESERLSIRRRFGSKAPERIILIAQIRTISLSVNELVTASNAIFASLSLQRDDLVQARDRLNRIGQTQKMTFWFPLARGTVDEVIYKSHQSRTSLEKTLLEHIQGNV